MTTESKPTIGHPQPEADRVATLLEEADFMPEEILIPAPESFPVPVSQIPHQSPNQPAIETNSGESEIRVLVHSLDGGNRGRADAIFGRRNLDVEPSIRSEDESPHSWVKPLFSETRR